MQSNSVVIEGTGTVRPAHINSSKNWAHDGFTVLIVKQTTAAKDDRQEEIVGIWASGLTDSGHSATRRIVDRRHWSAAMNAEATRKHPARRN